MKYRVIEIARGVAAFSVVLSHVPSLAVLPGGPGVEFFFVLSGFIMGHLHFRDLGRPGEIPLFLWKRACRIYPTFWIAMVPLLYLFWSAPVVTPVNLAYWLSLAPLYQDDLLIVAWTLRHEVTFYLMIAVGMLPRVGPWIVGGWIALTLGLMAEGGYHQAVALTTPGVRFIVSPFVTEFAIGFLAGGLHGRLRLPVGVWFAVIAAAAAAVAWRLVIDDHGYVYGPNIARVVYGAGYTAIVVALVKIEEAGLWRPGRWALVAGGVSYPLYLTHTTTALYLDTYVWPALPVPLTVVRIGFLVAAVTVGLAVWYVIDRPLQRFLRRLGERLAAPRRRHAAAGAALG